MANFASWRGIIVIFFAIVTESRQVQNPLLMNQGRPGDRIILKSDILPEPQGRVGLTVCLLHCFQEMPDRFAGYLRFS